MEEADWQKLIDAWIAGASAEIDSPEYEANWWASSRVMDMCVDEPDLLWQFILRVYPRALSDKAEMMLSVGPIECLLHGFGAEYIDKIEKLAADNERFNYMLGGVWRGEVKDSIWDRFEKARNEEWDP